MGNRNVISILTFLFCILNHYSFGQGRVIDSIRTIIVNEKNDSLKAFYYSKIGKEFWYLNPDSAVFYTDKSYDIAVKKNIKGILPYSFNNYGVIDFIQGNYSTSLKKYF